MEKLLELITEMENPLVIASGAVLEKIVRALSERRGLVKASFRSFQEAARDLLGEYGPEARIALAREEGISPELAEIKLENSLLVDSRYQNQKIHELIRIKNKCRPFLKINPLLERLYENRPVLLVGAFFEGDRFQRALEIIKTKTDVIHYRFEKKRKKHRILEFSSYKEEIASLVQRVGKLLDTGVGAERIKIQKLPETYLPYLKEAFLLAGIDIELSGKHSLYECEHVQEFLEELALYMECPVSEAFEKAFSGFADGDLARVLNLYLREDYYVREIYEDLVHQLKKTTPGKEEFSNQIVVGDYRDQHLDAGDILFILGFNQDLFPETHLDEEYLADHERERLGLFTSREKNRAARKKALALINGTASVELSYSLNHGGVRVPLSGLASSLEHEVVKSERKDVSYVPKLEQIRLGKRLDLYYRYSETSPELFRLHSTWPEFAYRSYSHAYTGVNPEDLQAALPKTLSYTALDQYFRCRFLYYLERVLGISRVRNEEALFIGNLFHNLLEALLVEDPEEPEEFLKRKLAEYLQEENIELNAREEFFAGKYLEVLLRFRRFLKLEEETSSLKTVALEKSFRIPLRDGFVLEGKIDKIQSFSHDGEEYYVVVDYKSGNADIDLGRIVYGLNLQIPLYFYLLKHAGLSAKFGGGYLQRVLPNTVFGRDPRFSYEEQFFRFFRKTGYSPDRGALLEKLDRNYGHPLSTLRGIRTTKSGFHADSLRFMLSEEEFEQILAIVGEKIEAALAGILAGDFRIDPKKSRSFDSCEYCPYKDLCFRDERDYVRIREYKNLSFLRGTDDTEEA